MADPTLRALERQWQETGAPSDEAAWLRERVRSGFLDRRRVEILAAVQHPAAQLLAGEGLQRVLLLGKIQSLLLRLGEPAELGRHVAAMLNTEGVSRQHCRLELRSDGSVEVFDLGSRNGTYVGGERVERGVLRVGDELNLGGSCRLRLADELTGVHIPLNTDVEAYGGPGIECGMAWGLEPRQPLFWPLLFLELGPACSMRVALAAASIALPFWEGIRPSEPWARGVFAAAEAWLECPCAPHGVAIDTAYMDGHPLYGETTTGSYDRGGTLASANEWAYKEGYSEELVACYAVLAPGQAFLRSGERNDQTAGSLQNCLDAAALCAGRPALEAQLRHWLVPWLRDPETN